LEKERQEAERESDLARMERVKQRQLERERKLAEDQQRKEREEKERALREKKAAEEREKKLKEQKQRDEQLRLAREKREREDKEREEQMRLAREKRDKEEKEREEQMRLAREKREREEKLREEQMRLAREKREKEERELRERENQLKLAREKRELEEQRERKVREERERKERENQLRIARDKKDREEKERKEKERKEKEFKDQEQLRLAREKREREEREHKEREERDRAEQLRVGREKREREERERDDQLKAARAKREQSEIEQREREEKEKKVRDDQRRQTLQQEREDKEKNKGADQEPEWLRKAREVRERKQAQTSAPQLQQPQYPQPQVDSEVEAPAMPPRPVKKVTEPVDPSVGSKPEVPQLPSRSTQKLLLDATQSEPDWQRRAREARERREEKRKTALDLLQPVPVPDQNNEEDLSINEREIEDQLKNRTMKINTINFDKYVNNTELSGFLNKKDAATLVKQWRVRWFTLQESKLLYYKEAQKKFSQALGNPPVGIISLHDAKKIEATEKNRFVIVTPERTYELEANSPQEREKWIAGLQESVVVGNKVSAHMLLQGTALKKEDFEKKEGYLSRLGRTFKNWKRAYFVLGEGMLQYFHHKGGKVIGKVPLYDCDFSSHQSSSHEYCFKISGTDHKKEVIMAASSDLEMQSWLNAILKHKIIIEEEINAISF